MHVAAKKAIALSLAVGAALRGCAATSDAGATIMDRSGSVVFVANDKVRVGIDISKGGSIVYVSTAGSRENIINDHDLGRQIQPSYYSGPKPFGAPSPHWKGWGWNPIGSGDVYGNGAAVDAWRFKNGVLYTRTTPLQWALNGTKCECFFESWLILEGSHVDVLSRLTNRRSDHTQYTAQQQELPAVYTTGRLRRLVSYTGDDPFTEKPLSNLPASFPWSTWRASEGWAALVDKAGWGLGVINPDAHTFTGGFGGPQQDGGPDDPQTGYMGPALAEIIDHNITYEYRYRLVLGTVSDIRAAAKAIRHVDPRPDYLFKSDRQHWFYANAIDSGWPITGRLQVRTDSGDPQLKSPVSEFSASGVPAIYVTAAFKGFGGEAQLFWATSEDPDFSESKSVKIPAPTGLPSKDYKFSLSGHPLWKGTIVALRFDPPAGGPSGVASICAISWRPIAC